MHISISLQHSKKAAVAAQENSGKERKRIDELEAIQVRERGEGRGGGSHHKECFGTERNEAAERLKTSTGFLSRFPCTYAVCIQKVNRFLM